MSSETASEGKEAAKSGSERNTTTFVPFIKTVQKLAIYETRSRFYIVGSNTTETSFRILKVHRNEPKSLVLSDENRVYTYREMRDLLNMVDVGNRSKVGQKVGNGLQKVKSAFGIAGFVRFLEGYYIVLITKRRRAATIGHHSIYKIEDTDLVYIPSDDVREPHQDEARYVKMFQAMDMSSNFYYSYSYDVTNTLQHNLADPTFLSQGGTKSPVAPLVKDGETYSYISKPNHRFVWNEHLLSPMLPEPSEGGVSLEWILPIIHGFVDQANINIFGRPVLLTIIARRSNRFAGTRFLKRGANFNGDVANEVETEQIVADSSISSLTHASLTSFVQIRGSFPGHWTQDIKTHMAKPPIHFQLPDPFGRTSGNHFNHLLKKYGSPAVVVNLVKKREKRRQHESLIGEEFQKQVSYLNQFLPERDHIKYVHLDMARCKKREDTEVMSKLADIAVYGIKSTGIFHRDPRPFVEKGDGKPTDPLIAAYYDKVAEIPLGKSLSQTGVVRTNCVDCLDRTNTAQFVVGKCALGLQLYALGFLDSTNIEYDSDAARMLEAMYEDHGDTLALQYGGSQLIHRIQSYRKRGRWTNKANDIAQTLRRYYSNTLSDAEKQNAMNVFLGVYQPSREKVPIWDREAQEAYLHLEEPQANGGSDRYNTRWYEACLKDYLPLPLLENLKEAEYMTSYRKGDQSTDSYIEYYRPYEFNSFHEHFHIKDVTHSTKDFMPNCCTDYSPFAVRQRQTKRHEEALSNVSKSSIVSFFMGRVPSSKNLYGLPGSDGGGSSPLANSSSVVITSNNASSASNNSSSRSPSLATSNSDSDEDDDDPDLSASEDFDWLEGRKGKEDDKQESEEAAFKYEDVYKDSEEVYGFKLKPPSAEDARMYERYAELSSLETRKAEVPAEPVPPMVDEDRANTQASVDQPLDFKGSDGGFWTPSGDIVLKPLSQEDIKAYEAYLGVKFPDDLENYYY